MKLLNKHEIKLFITFFVLYLAFIQWIGWNEESRTALTKAIVREGRLEIDTYANMTADRVRHNYHYYSDKAPGSSFLAVPIYVLSDFISNYLPSYGEEYAISQPWRYTTIYHSFNITTKDMLGQILSVILLSVLPGALLTVFIYKTSGFFINDQNRKLFVAISFGVGTLIFPYSAVFMGVLLGGFFGFVGFYIVLKTLKTQGNLNKKHLIVSGIILGFSVVVEYTMLPILAVVSLYSFFSLSKKQRKSVVYLFTGIFIGLLPLIIYNLIIFSNPFRLSIFYSEVGAVSIPMSAKEIEGFNQLISIISSLPDGFAKTLFFPYRGVFFYSPILFLSILGLYYLYKDDKNLTIIIILILLLFVVSISSFSSWFGGSSFSMRYFVPFVPFLSIPFAVFLDKGCRRSYFKVVVFALLLISIFHNFIGFGADWEGVSYERFENNITAKLAWSTGSFKVDYRDVKYLNPLYNHYLPKFIDDGPRSKILERLFYNPSNIDIRSSNPMPVREIKLFTTPIGTLVLKIPFLAIPILLIVTTLVWKKELSRIFVFKKMTLLSVLVVLIILLFVSRLEVKNLVYVSKIGNPEQSWYEQLETEDLRWMQQNARISLFNSNKSQERRLFFYIRSFNKDRNFTVFINGNLIDKFVALKEGEFVHTPIFNLLQGENLIEFYSEENCDIPHFVIDSDDPRCLSIGIKDLSLKSVEENSIVFGRNWYEGEEKWMKNDGTVLLYNFDDNNRKIKLYIDAQGYINDWPISMFLNDGLADRFTVFKESSKIYTSMITLEPGETILRFHSDEGCTITNEVVNFSDKRCLSIIIKSITVVTMDELISENKILNFGYNWYDSEEIDSTRWMNQDGTIHLINFDNNPKEVKFYSYLKSYYEDRKINIYLNNQLIDSLIAFKEGAEVYTPMITLKPGENMLKFHSDEGCEIISEFGERNDNRCISIGVKNVSLLSQNEIKERALDYIFNKNWYDKITNENERWMNNNATISLFYFDSPYKSAILNFDFFPYFKERTVSFYLNEELKNVFEIDKDGGWVYTAPLLLKSGENVLRFYSEEGCTVIDDVDKNGDYRCVSLNMRNITLS